MCIILYTLLYFIITHIITIIITIICIIHTHTHTWCDILSFFLLQDYWIEFKHPAAVPFFPFISNYTIHSGFFSFSHSHSTFCFTVCTGILLLFQYQIWNILHPTRLGTGETNQFNFSQEFQIPVTIFIKLTKNIDCWIENEIIACI